MFWKKKKPPDPPLVPKPETKPQMIVETVDGNISIYFINLENNETDLAAAFYGMTSGNLTVSFLESIKKMNHPSFKKFFKAYSNILENTKELANEEHYYNNPVIDPLDVFLSRKEEMNAE